VISAPGVATRVRRDWRSLAWWAPLPFVAAYAIALVVNFRDIITAINRNSDAVIALMIGKLWGEAGPESTVELGNHPWYEELLLLRATSGVPFYRELWYVTPLLLGVGALALLLWSIWRLYGALAAVLAGSALLCVGHLGRFMFFSFNWHSFAVVHLVVMGVALVWAVTRVKPWRLPPLVGFSLAIGLFSALAMASDPAFRYWSLIPLLGTAGLVAWRLPGAPRRIAIVYSGIVAATSVVGGALLAGIMKDQGVDASVSPTTFATVDKLVPNLELLLQGFTGLAGGAFFGAKPDLPGIATLVSGTLALAGIYFALRECRHWARSEVLAAEGTPEAGRFIHLAFWGFLLVVTLLAFLLSSAPVDVMSARFLLPAYVAVGALLPAIAMRSLRAQALATAAVTLFAATGVYHLIRHPAEPGGPFPDGASTNAVLAFAEENDISVGYADFWVGPSLTWLADFEVELFPVDTCGRLLCRDPLVHISTWYEERPRQNSMLVVDANQPGVQPPSPALGKPMATRTFGALTMYAYDFDLARRIQ
jgi:hypothetical protein